MEWAVVALETRAALGAKAATPETRARERRSFMVMVGRDAMARQKYLMDRMTLVEDFVVLHK
jgi:hypothetical protein